MEMTEVSPFMILVNIISSYLILNHLRFCDDDNNNM